MKQRLPIQNSIYNKNAKKKKKTVKYKTVKREGNKYVAANMTVALFFCSHLLYSCSCLFNFYNICALFQLKLYGK